MHYLCRRQKVYLATNVLLLACICKVADSLLCNVCEPNIATRKSGREMSAEKNWSIFFQCHTN